MADYSNKTSNHTPIFFNSLPSPLLTLLFIISLCLLGFFFLHHSSSSPTHTTATATATAHFHQLFVSAATNYTLSTYLRSLTLHPHLSGTPPSLQTLHYVHTHFANLGLRTHTVSFDALLSYPTRSSLSLTFKDSSSRQLTLSDDVGHDGVVVPYHAYSPSGAAYAKAVFVNYGRPEDYRALAALGVNVTGCVAVARRGEGSRGEVVAVAAENGVAAVLMYTVGVGFSNGVERGTVMRGLGDPLTPGWAAEEGGERMKVEDGEVEGRFPGIPSMPISAEDAEVILRSLEGPRAPPEWRWKVGRVGAGPTMVNFSYQVRILMGKHLGFLI